MNRRASAYIEGIRHQIINYRRDFHKHPEVGWTEFRTASIIARRLTELGFDVKLGQDVVSDKDRMGLPTEEELDYHFTRAIEQGADEEFIRPLKGGYTGVVGTLNLGEGPVVALRFDIDALKVNESNLDEHFPSRIGFSSLNEGIMHSCAHDCHAAIGLGVAEALANFKDEIANAGVIKLIFQPAEEGVRGAKSMVGAGVLDDVDYVIGGHMMAMKSGQLVCGANGFMATTKLDVTFKGLSAHAGGAPNEGKNSMLAACTAVLNVNSIPRHAEGASRINVGKLDSGTDRNVIAEDSFMKMEIRGETNKINQYAEEYVHRIIESSAKMHDVDYKIDYMGAAPSGRCSENLIQRVKKVGEELGCFNEVIESSNAAAGSEDFIYMMNKVQENNGEGVYFMVGSNKVSGHHTSLFDIDESDLIKAVRLYVSLTFDLIGVNTNG